MGAGVGVGLGDSLVSVGEGAAEEEEGAAEDVDGAGAADVLGAGAADVEVLELLPPPQAASVRAAAAATQAMAVRVGFTGCPFVGDAGYASSHHG